MRNELGKAISVGSIGEFLGNDKTKVSLDKHSKDKHGLPLARIDSYLDEMSIKRLSFMAAKCRQILKATGSYKLVEEFGTADFFSTTHTYGTCRMGQDKKQSVVNSDCRSHDISNLYICDASVFPSSGGGESPSLTIQALAIKAADSIIANIGYLSSHTQLSRG
jgi:choline dehydrogenase-like flavoprotein